MNVYVLLSCDHHRDDVVEVYSSAPKALRRADAEFASLIRGKKYPADSIRDFVDEGKANAGTIFYKLAGSDGFQYSVEVMKRKVS